jgi:phosphohistidine phosphatase
VDALLIRHAQAVDETVERRDPHRHLTAHGREQATRLGEQLRGQACAPTHIWTSPLVRAVQTAELVARALAPGLTVEVFTSLGPSEPLQSLVDALKALPADACVLVAGHEPGLSGLGGVLLARELISLARAEAVRISDGKLQWRFAWDTDAPVIAT